MKIYGKTNIFSGSILSNVSEESNKPQNLVVVPDLTLLDPEVLDKEITIIDTRTHSINTTHGINSNWKDCIDVIDNQLFFEHDIELTRFSRRRFSGNINNFLSIDSELFNFGEINSPENFVIDFNLYFNTTPINGTILYNGLNTGQVDLEINKNLLITTSGSILIKDPNFQLDPSVQTNVADDGYLNIYRPRLKSAFKFERFKIYHVAIIRSGDTTYLAIDGKINDSAPSVEYFHYDPVKIGAGYVGAFGGDIWNLRISKGTDRGWTKTFTPPQYDQLIDQFTDYLLSSDTLNDLIGNHIRTTVGSVPVKYEDLIEPYYFKYDEYFVKLNIFSNDSTSTDIITFIFPNLESQNNYHFKFIFDSNLLYSQCSFQCEDIGNINYDASNVATNVATFYKEALIDSSSLQFKSSSFKWVQYFESNDVKLQILPLMSFPTKTIYNWGAIYPDSDKTLVTANGTLIQPESQHVKLIQDHPFNNNLPILDLSQASGLSSGLSQTYFDASDTGYLTEFIFRFTGNPISNTFLLKGTTPDAGAYDAIEDYGIVVTPGRQLYIIPVWYYYNYYWARTITFGTTHYENQYKTVQSQNTAALTLNHWYHVYILEDGERNIGNYMRKRVTVCIDDLTDNLRFYSSILFNSQYTYYYYNYYSTWSDGTLWTRTIYNHQQFWRPSVLGSNLPIQLAMLRMKSTNPTIPTEFKKYYSYGEFLQSC